VGNCSGKRIRWDGTTLTIKGDLVFDSNNYWYPGGNFKVGSDSHYLYWDGTTFTIQGKLVAQSGSTIDGAYITNATITADKLDVDYLSAISANLGTITAAKVTVDTAGYIRGGKTGYGSGTGWWLGYSSGYKFDIGSDSAYLRWDGSQLYVRGEGHFGDDDDYTVVGDSSYKSAILFYANGSYAGNLHGSSGGGLAFYASGGVANDYSAQIVPVQDNAYSLGSYSGNKWYAFYGYNVYTDELYSQATDRIDFHCRISPSDHASYDNGLSNHAWNNVYYCVANDVCSLGMVEEIGNPLELIANIKTSEDKYTPKDLPKADYKTLPKFIKTVKYSDLKKDRKDFKEYLQSILSKNAEITYEDDEKVTVRIEALDVTATISLLLGAIRQLNKKIEALEGH